MKTTRVISQSYRWVAWLMAGLVILNITLALAQSENPTPSGSTTWDYSALAKVPAKAQTRHNPLDGDPDAVAAGRKIFAEHCSECHGKDAGGARRGPNLRLMAAHEATPGALFYVLTNGVIRHGMPGWSKLPEPERWQLVSFLCSLQEPRK
jgi:mono/diheme cytochrome c family protein